MQNKTNKQLLIGNEAIGRGAIEAGISLATSYAGTPATQILEYLAHHFSGRAEWAVNEKVALETAIGASYAGKRAICSMKHVGLNVAADPLMTSAYLGIHGGLVLAVGDDPGAYSSQNEQDSRIFARFANIPCLEPSNSQEAKDFTKFAFDLSEKFRLPVMLRGLTRVMHSSSPVTMEEPRAENPLALEKNPEQQLAIPKNVVRFHTALNKKQGELKDWVRESGLNTVSGKSKKKAIIACGFASVYAGEYGEDCAILKISAYPFHDELIKDFVRGRTEVWVLEEGEPIVEEIARKYSKKVRGKLSGDIRREGELGPDVLAPYFGGATAAPDDKIESLPMRPPVMCPGCPHREFYKSLKAAAPSFTAGDIGCYTLGATPPLSAMDSCLCMGASIGKAAGIANQGVKRVAAVIGDSTFIHSGITGLINAVYNNANILVCILDNSSTAMTGHQPTPLLGVTAKGETGGQVDLVALCKACGVASVSVLDPFQHAEMEKIIREKIDAPGVNVIISKKPCVLIGRKKKQ
ncbi:MAG TPA: thiamine pyrophosphate-dependent enzyme [Dissulfurispiraceae bacterium]|nr:thiamine pyrophosphate-dependent enzyme [Dissulfurispiraceae bacterium]